MPGRYRRCFLCGTGSPAVRWFKLAYSAGCRLHSKGLGRVKNARWTSPGLDFLLPTAGAGGRRTAFWAVVPPDDRLGAIMYARVELMY